MSKVATYSKVVERRADGTVIYWRTGKGSMRHASFYCANSKRSIFTGDCIPLSTAEAADWAPCADCCTDADVAAARVAEEAKRAANCDNPGVVHKHRIYSNCKGCGRFGKVTGGRLRNHLPQGVKREQAPAAPAAAPAASLDELTFPALMEIAKLLKVPGRGTARKPQLIEGIRAVQAGR